MEKSTYLLASYKNIQELIRFTDQKIGAVLVLCGIQLTLFWSNGDSLSFLSKELNLLQILINLSGIIFILLIVAILYLSIVKILKPRFARNYKEDEYTCLYFNHIASEGKHRFDLAVQDLDEKQIREELKDQIYEISKILSLKNRYCSIVMMLLFISILILTLYIFATTLI